MGVFDTLADILSGRRLHKNRTNNVVLSILWRRCSLLPVHQELFREYVVSASIVADALFFSADRPREVNAKNYSIDQFQLFYEAVIALRTFAGGLAYPRLRQELRLCLGRLVADRVRVEQLLTQLDTHGAVDQAGVVLVYEHLREEVGIATPTITPLVTFTVACLTACGAQDFRPEAI